MPYIGRAPTASITKLEDADQDTKIQVEESSDEDTIRFDIAGAEDFTMTANTLTALSGSTIATNTIAETTGASGVTIDGLLIKDSTAAFADGAVGTPSITNTGDLNSGVYFPAADTVGMVTGGTERFRFGSNPIPGGSKNLLINGSMTVAQRLTQTSVGAADGDKTACDMWKVLKRGSPEGRVTATQTNDTNMNLNGHEYTCKLDCTTAESAVAATEAHTLSQSIEAQNLQGLKYGTANAEAVTLSFWFSSPKTGIHCASIYLSDTGYSQVKEFTIASANTWEYFSLTFSANTSNKINNDTGSGMIVSFALTAGTNFQVPADAWGAAEDFATSNQQNLLDNTSNSVSLAGVQLEIGSVATDFAHEDIGTTLDLCRRYYQQINSSDSAGTWGVGACYSTTSAGVTQFLPTTMRAAPTISISAASDFQMSTDATTEVSSVSFETGGAISAVPFISGFWVIGSANHTANEAVRLRAKTSNAKVYLTAEL